MRGKVIVVTGNKYRVLVGRDAVAMDVLSRMMPERAARFVARKMKSMLS